MTDVLDCIAAEFRPPSRDPILAAPAHRPGGPPPYASPDVPLFELTPELIDAASIEERDHIVRDLEKQDMLRLPFDEIAIRFPYEKIADVLGVLPLPDDVPDAKTVLTMFVEGALSVKPCYATSKEFSNDEYKRGVTQEEMEAQVAKGEAEIIHVVNPRMMSPTIYSTTRSGTKEFDLNELDKDDAGTSHDFHAIACEALTILLASLAARNVVKDVRYNGRVSKGANSKPVYEDNGVTYISRTVVRPPPASEMENDPDHPPRGHSVPHLRRGHQHTVVYGKGRVGRRLQWFDPTYVNYDPAFMPKPHKYVVRP
jgi:hypothetical protein